MREHIQDVLLLLCAAALIVACIGEGIDEGHPWMACVFAAVVLFAAALLFESTEREESDDA